MEKLWDIATVARVTGKHENAIRRALWSGKLPHYRLRKQTIRVATSDLIAYLRDSGMPEAANKIRSSRPIFQGQDFTPTELGYVLSVDRNRVYDIMRESGLPWKQGWRHESMGPERVRVVPRNALESWLKTRRRLGK